MKQRNRVSTATLHFLVLLMLCSSFALAQLSTSVSGSLSSPLDNDLSGLDSNVAPIPTSQIEPGANNLMTPDERALPFDAIGASLEATLMTPALTQFNPLSRVPFQLDTTVKDVAFATGLHPLAPLVVVDVIPRRTVSLNSSQSSASSFNHLSTTLAGQLPGSTASGVNSILSSAITLQSSWKAGSTTAPSLMINPLQSSTEPTQPLVQPSSSTTDGGVLLDKKSKDKRGTVGSDLRLTKQPQDYSRSPLEAPTDQERLASASESPFASLNQRNFLNPDITSASAHLNSSTRKTDRSLTVRSRLENRPRTTAQLRNREMLREQPQLMKQSSRTEQTSRPKWHNPILQQMEDGTNPKRR